MTILRTLKDFLKKGDLLLLGLCLVTSMCSLVLIYSATRYDISLHSYAMKQAAFVVLGVFAYIFMTFVDIELIIDKSWKFLFVFGVLLILLIIPFGVEGDTGNKSWVYLPGISVGIQPAEIVKIFFVMLLARLMDRQRSYGISKPRSVFKLAALTLFFAGLIAVVSEDFGMVLVYLFIFAIMAFVAGVKLRWFALALGAAAGLFAVAWSHLPSYIQMRILVVFDHDLDPTNVGWHQTRSLLAIGSGQLTGMGYLNGKQTHSPSSALPARHTDFIFSVCGEEFGLIGCCFLLLLLLSIVLRCIYVSRRAKSHMCAYVSLGFAGMLIIQTVLNVGMCLYLMPVVGLTLPLISYGGSSTLTIYAAMGVVSSIKMRSLPSWLKDRNNL